MKFRTFRIVASLLFLLVLGGLVLLWSHLPSTGPVPVPAAGVVDDPAFR